MNAILLIGFHLNYERNNENITLGWIHLLFYVTGVNFYLGFINLESLNGVIMSILATISSMIGGTILLWIFSSSVLTFLKYIEKTHDMKEELNQILENLEESIMIISDFKADFINKRFLANFSKDIIAHIPNDPPSTGNNLEIPSKLVRLKQFLRNTC